MAITAQKRVAVLYVASRVVAVVALCEAIAVLCLEGKSSGLLVKASMVGIAVGSALLILDTILLAARNVQPRTRDTKRLASAHHSSAEEF